jgi:hypothetical protein
MPVQDPVKLKFTGPASMMFQNAYPGPVSGNGYYAKPGQVIEVESVDVEALIATGNWSLPLRKRQSAHAGRIEPSGGNK